jgi:SsrA-binding protein
MAPKGSERTVRRVVAENRKARFNYEIVDTYEAGLVLTGTEVKSLREGKANIAESYATDEGGEIWLINSYVPEYLQANRFNHETRRRRKLLLSKREVNRLQGAVNREGMSLVPLRIYFNERGGRSWNWRSPRARSCTTSARRPRSATGTVRRTGCSRSGAEF